jgi:iron complex transport system substrate-binding protein
MVISRYVGLLAATLTLMLVAASGAAGYGSPITVSSEATTPTRIVSLSPTATEDLFAIGAGKQVVAVDNQSNYPASAPHTKLSGYTPNVEAIAGYKPDLVVVSADLGHVVEGLGKLKIPVLVEPTASTLAAAYKQLDQLGAATGHKQQAASVVTGMQTQIASIAKSVPHPAKPITVYHELEQDLYSATSKTFIGRIYALLGLKDIADAADKSGSGYPQLSAEYVVATDPQLIVLADTKCCAQTAAKVAKRPGWNTIAAVQKGDVLAVDDDIASRWGPRVVDFVRIVAAKVRAIAAGAH